jgi:hypothetical protein
MGQPRDGIESGAGSWSQVAHDTSRPTSAFHDLDRLSDAVFDIASPDGQPHLTGTERKPPWPWLDGRGRIV